MLSLSPCRLRAVARDRRLALERAQTSPDLRVGTGGPVAGAAGTATATLLRAGWGWRGRRWVRCRRRWCFDFERVRLVDGEAVGQELHRYGGRVRPASRRDEGVAGSVVDHGDRPRQACEPAGVADIDRVGGRAGRDGEGIRSAHRGRAGWPQPVRTVALQVASLVIVSASSPVGMYSVSVALSAGPGPGACFCGSDRRRGGGLWLPGAAAGCASRRPVREA